MSKRVTLKPGAEVDAGGQRFCIEQVLDLENVLARDVNSGEAKSLKVRDLAPVQLQPSEPPALTGDPDLAIVSDDAWQIARARFAIIQPLLSSAGYSRGEVGKRARAAGINIATMYRWLQRYHRSGRIAALLPAERTGRPDILVYRRTEELNLGTSDPRFLEKYAQWRQVEAFFAEFRNPDRSIRRGYNDYPTPDAFERTLNLHLRERIRGFLEAAELVAAPAAPVPAAAATPAPPLWAGSPFPGLRAFTPDDAPIFFGRGTETDGLVQKLADPGLHFLAAVGASGSGKSSLVAAGLLPRLKASAIEGSKDWVLPWVQPGAVGKG